MPKLGDWEVRSADARGTSLYVSEDGSNILVKASGDDLGYVSLNNDGTVTVLAAREARVRLNAESKIVSIGQA